MIRKLLSQNLETGVENHNKVYIIFELRPFSKIKEIPRIRGQVVPRLGDAKNAENNYHATF
jgi:hypothetical protein